MTAPLANLYGLRAIDESDPSWARFDFYQETTGSAAAQFNSAVIEPPPEKVWFLTGVYALIQGTVGVIPISVRFNLVNTRVAAGIILAIAGVRFNPGLAAASTGIFSQKVDVVAVGGESGVRTTFGYDVGNAANVQHWSFYGYQVPKGNIQI